LAGGYGFWTHREAFTPADKWRNHRACVGRTRTAKMAWPCVKEECYMTYLSLRGLHPNLSARGSLVICLTQRDSYILTLGFLGKPSFQTASHFLAPRFRFSSPVFKESDLRVYGSFHGCVDLLLVACVIFNVFFELGASLCDFVRALFLQFCSVWVRICWWDHGSLPGASLCLIMTSQTPNSASD
jgi:hypothetical protein